MHQKLFILGVGAQKAGTTWLHRYLSADPAVAKGSMKEYHVWNALYETGDGVPDLEAALSGDKQVLRERLIAEPELYFDHFASLLDGTGKRIAMDITPAYAALPSQAFEHIRNGFARRHIAVKVVFLMRDPVERCWSAVRMYGRRQAHVAGMGWTGEPEDWLIRYSLTSNAQARGGYDRTVEALNTAFPDQAYFGFYETLFQQASVERLSAFLEVQPRPLFGLTRFNEAPRRAAPSDEARRAVAAHFRPVFDYCSTHFPEATAIWPSYRLLR